MDGRQIAALLILVAAVGCRSTKTTSGMPPQAASTGSFLERAFTKSPPGPMKQQAELVVEKENNSPLKSDTVATFADLTVDATFNNEDLSLAERDRRLDDARVKFQKALEQDPKNVEVLRGLGRLYTRMGDNERATQVYQEALRMHPKHAQLTHEAALSAGRFENWPSAVALWEHAMSLDPGSRKYPRLIGLAHARMGNYDASFSALMKVCPEAEARTLMARELMDAGQMAAGKEQLEMALKVDPSFGPAQQMMGGPIQQAGYQQ